MFLAFIYLFYFWLSKTYQYHINALINGWSWFLFHFFSSSKSICARSCAISLHIFFTFRAKTASAQCIPRQLWLQQVSLFDSGGSDESARVISWSARWCCQVPRAILLLMSMNFSLSPLLRILSRALHCFWWFSRIVKKRRRLPCLALICTQPTLLPPLVGA